MLVMNGYEYEFDLFDLETAEKCDKAFADIYVALEEIAENEKLPVSIQLQCDAIRNCIDEIFGEGEGIRVCGEKYNLTKHLDAYESLVDDAIRQRKEHENRGRKYIQNREQRRFQKKETAEIKL